MTNWDQFLFLRWPIRKTRRRRRTGLVQGAQGRPRGALPRQLRRACRPLASPPPPYTWRPAPQDGTCTLSSITLIRPAMPVWVWEIDAKDISSTMSITLTHAGIPWWVREMVFGGGAPDTPTRHWPHTQHAATYTRVSETRHQMYDTCHEGAKRNFIVK